MELFNFGRYRKNLAEDLKDVRKTDPEKAKKLLAQEKGKSTTTQEFRHWEYDENKRSLTLPPTVRYSEAEKAHKAERKEAQENSPVLKAKREENERLALEAKILEGEKGKEKLIEFLSNVDRLFIKAEQEIVQELHPLLRKEKDHFVYDIHVDDDLWISLDGEEVTDDRKSSSVKNFNKAVINLYYGEGPRNGGATRSDDINKAFNAFYLPEYQEEIDGIKTGIIKTDNLYFNKDYSTERFLLASPTKDDLVNYIKNRIDQQKK